MNIGKRVSLDEISLESALNEGAISAEDMLSKVRCEEFGLLVQQAPQAAARAVDLLGGVRVYIPIEINDKSPLAITLGVCNAKQVVKWLGGGSLHFPRMEALRRRVRNQKLARLRKAGWAPKDLALNFNLTQRQIYVILKQERTK